MNPNQAFCYALCLILITLKLTGHIAWPWLAVLAPLWVPVAILALMLLVAVSILGIKQTRAAMRGEQHR